MFFPFPVLLWAICLPLLLQCVICTKWGFKSLFADKIRREARRLPVPHIFSQECQECPELCGPHLLSQLNNKNGAMPKPSSRKSLMNTFVCRALGHEYSPRQTIISQRHHLISPDAIWWLQRQAWGGKSDPGFNSWPLFLASQPQASAGQAIFYNPPPPLHSLGCGDLLFSTFLQNNLCHILSGGWISEPEKG